MVSFRVGDTDTPDVLLAASLLGPTDLATVVVIATVVLAGLRSHGKSIRFKLGDLEATMNEVKGDLKVVDRAVNGRGDQGTTVSQDVAEALKLMLQSREELAVLRGQHAELTTYIHTRFHDLNNQLTITKGKADLLWDFHVAQEEAGRPPGAGHE